jgi:hypothetical protein
MVDGCRCLFELIAALCVARGGGDPPPLRPADLFDRTYVGATALAPDGRHALVFESTGAGGPARLVAIDWGIRGATRTEHELPADAWGHITFDPVSGAALFLRGSPPTSEVWIIESGGEPRRVLPPGISSGVFDLFRQQDEAAPGGGRWLALSNSSGAPREALLSAIDLRRANGAKSSRASGR